MFSRRAGILSLLLLAAFPRMGSAHSMPLSDRQKVADSEHIVVATVAASAARWNDQHSMIVTDYTLRVEDRLKGAAPAEVRLTQPGGTVGDITDHSCLSVSLERGTRYLLFLGDLATPTIAPVTGSAQGVFREVIEADGSRSAAGAGVKTLAIDGRPIPFATLVAAVRDLVAKVAAEPAAPKAASAVSDFPLTSKAYDPSRRAAVAARVVLPAPLPGVRSVPGGGGDDLAAETAAPKFVLGAEPPNAPIVVNPLPASSSWSPKDQEQMSYWNLYSSRLFRVMSPPSATWAYGNGTFDIAGFPDSEQMRQQFGWAWTGSVLGVTFWRTQGDTLTEADIALNPAVAWTLDRAQANNPASALWPFRQTMVHELGHAWGLLHPWEGENVKWDSVLNYSPKAYRLATLWADDTQAARRTYPGTNIRDGAVAVYTTRDNPSSTMPYYIPALAGPFAVRPGQPIAVTNPVRVENVGTVTLKNPKVEVYLTPRYGSLEGAILLKTVTVSATLPAYAVKNFSLGSLAVPATVRQGSYHLALVLRDSADAYQGNNVAWSPQR